MATGWFQNRWAVAWATLTAAFALHVLDEATHDFLSWYNPAAAQIRESMGGIPFPPSFSFRVWLTLLCIGIVALAALTPLVKPGRKWMVVLASAYGLLHTGNAIAHLAVSAAGGWLAPGVLSAPVLLAAALWLLVETTRVVRMPRAALRS